MTMPTPIKAHRGSGPEDNAPHILVVDDDSRIRDLLARYLQEHGFRVSTAVDAASARAAAGIVQLTTAGRGTAPRAP